MITHPLNTDFEWQPVAAAPTFLTQDHIDQYNRDGFCLVEQAFSADTIAAVTAAIDPWEQGATEFLRQQPNGEFFIAQADSITFTVHLVSRSDVCRDFSRHPSLLGIAGDLVGPDVRMYWDQAVYKKPEPDREFPWHQDNGYAFVEPQQYLTCWIPLTDATLDNGCPWVVPGLHRAGTLTHRSGAFGLTCLDADDAEAARAVPVEAPAGSAVVFSSLTPHRTGPNLTDQVRKSYIVQYAPDGALIHRDGTLTPANAADRQYSVLRDGRAV